MEVTLKVLWWRFL